MRFSTEERRGKNNPQGDSHISTKSGGVVDNSAFEVCVDVGGDVLDHLGDVGVLFDELLDAGEGAEDGAVVAVVEIGRASCRERV